MTSAPSLYQGGGSSSAFSEVNDMLSETKAALRISTDAYDQEIAALLSAAARDLEIAGVVIPGTVDITFDDETGAEDLTDITDPLIQMAMITYVRMHFGSPDDYDRLASAYELQKVQLMHADQYTDFGG